jgi:hypothetical protein
MICENIQTKPVIFNMMNLVKKSIVFGELEYIARLQLDEVPVSKTISCEKWWHLSPCPSVEFFPPIF